MTHFMKCHFPLWNILVYEYVGDNTIVGEKQPLSVFKETAVESSVPCDTSAKFRFELNSQLVLSTIRC